MNLSEISYTSAYWLFLLPVVWIALDVITGWIQASVNGTWDSTKMRKGLFRKGGEFLVAVAAFVTQCAIPVLQEMHIARLESIYIVIMEVLSVIENLDQAGIPVPAFLHDKLKKLKEDADNGEIETNK